MRSIAPIVALALLPAGAQADFQDPAPAKVEPNPAKLDVTVLRDSAGGTYVVFGVEAFTDWSAKGADTQPQPGPKVDIFYGKGKTLYQQHEADGVRNSSHGTGWMARAWAPRIPNTQKARIEKRSDSFYLDCGGEGDAVLGELTGTKATEVMTRYSFKSPLHVRVAHVLARDDGGVYYLVDKLRAGAGWRLLVGKKGALKPMQVNDVTSDAAGELFIARTGTLKIDIVDTDVGPGQIKRTKKMTWLKGERQRPLTWVDYANDIYGPRMVYRDLGVYPTIGTICDDI